jgi:hypothetical protein
MTTARTARFGLVVLGLAAGGAAATAQDPSSPAARLKVRFRSYDINADGWLSGRELTACGCRASDRNGDGEITWEEFRDGPPAGGGARPAATDDDDAPTPAPLPAPRAASPAPVAQAPRTATGAGTGIGDPVRVMVDGIPYFAHMLGGANGRYRIQFETPPYGHAEEEWVPAATVKNLDYTQFRPDFIAPAPVPGRVYQLAEHVAVVFQGRWYGASITSAANGRYQVQIDGRTSGEQWFTANEIRPLGPRVVDRPTPVAGLPRSVPTGRYVCTTLMGGFQSTVSTRTTIGDLRITGPGTYTGVTKQGAGAGARYAYDPATGAIEWGGGRLQGFDAMIESTTFSVTPRGAPLIDVVYLMRQGGHRYNLTCERP